MAFTVNKTRVLERTGLADVSILAPVIEWSRMQNNGDGTITVVLDIYQDQATFDAQEGAPYEQRSYQIDAHPNVDVYLLNELKKLTDFDSAT